jgi:hypothetical protein
MAKKGNSVAPPEPKAKAEQLSSKAVLGQFGFPQREGDPNNCDAQPCPQSRFGGIL